MIDDVVEGNLALLETDAADGEAMKVGSSDTIEIETLVEEVRDSLSQREPDLLSLSEEGYENRRNTNCVLPIQ